MLNALFSAAIHQQYNLLDFVLKPLIQEEWRQLYRIDCDGAPSLILRAYSHPNSDTRQTNHANVLRLLEKYDYPAPRLLYTQQDEAIIECITAETRWHLVITTFVEGNVLEGDLPITLGWWKLSQSIRRSSCCICHLACSSKLLSMGRRTFAK